MKRKKITVWVLLLEKKMPEYAMITIATTTYIFENNINRNTQYCFEVV